MTRLRVCVCVCVCVCLLSLAWKLNFVGYLH